MIRWVETREESGTGGTLCRVAGRSHPLFLTVPRGAAGHWCPPFPPGSHEGGGEGEGGGEQIGLIEQALAPGLGLEQQGLQRMAGHAAEGHSRHGRRRGRQGVHKGEAVAVGATGELQGTGWGEGTHGLQEAHSGPRGASAHITAHRPAIQLPKGPQACGPEQAEALPEVADQGGGVMAVAPGGLALQSAAHRQPAQGKGCGADLLQAGGEGLAAADLGVDLDRVRPEGGEEGAHFPGSQNGLALLDQTQGAGREAAPAAVAAVGNHPPAGADGQGRADPLAGPRAVGGAAVRVKRSLAKVGIIAIAEAHHEPGPRGAARLRPSHSPSSRRHHRSVSGHIEAMHPSKAVDPRQILNGEQVLVAGAADPFHPVALAEGLLRAPCGDRGGGRD